MSSEALSKIGYRQVEFAGYTQNANAEGGADLGTVDLPRGRPPSRADDNGLNAEGNYPLDLAWPLTPEEDLTGSSCRLEIANILGMQHVGTGNDPTRSDYKAEILDRRRGEVERPGPDRPRLRA